jgi:hypothetical protein
VGWFVKQQDRGFGREPLTEDHLLLITAAQPLEVIVRVGVGNAVELHHVGRELCFGSSADAVAAPTYPVQAEQRGILADRAGLDTAVRQAVSRDKSHAVADHQRGRGLAQVETGAVNLHRTPRTPVAPVEHRVKGTGVTAADETGDAEDLTPGDTELLDPHVAYFQVLNAQRDTRRRSGLRCLRGLAIVCRGHDRLDDDHVDERGQREVTAGSVVDAPAVTQNGDAVCPVGDVFQAVRHEHDAITALAYRLDEGEEPVGSVLGQICGRLVQHEQSVAVLLQRAKGPGDGDQGFRGRVQRADHHVHRHIEGQASERGPDLAASLPPVDPSPPMLGIAGQADVLHHGRRVDQGQVLVYEGQPSRGSAGRVFLQRLAVEQDHSARIWLVVAGQDLDQRRLPRSVVARERQQFTPANGQRYVIKHSPTAERLANTIDDQQRLRFRLNGRRAHDVKVTAAGMRLSRTAAAY